MNSGTVIANRYEIKSKIGKGGMQDVFLAYDSVLESNVALKTPLPGQGNRRFNQSAIIAARINHHNVAKTYDYFEFNGTYERLTYKHNGKVQYQHKDKPEILLQF